METSVKSKEDGLHDKFVIAMNRAADAMIMKFGDHNKVTVAELIHGMALLTELINGKPTLKGADNG